MIINDEFINKLALLSRLELSQEEIDKLKNSIPNILDQFSKLSEVNTDWVEPISQITWLNNITRKDEIFKCDFSKELVDLAPSQSTNWSFLVKNVF